MLCQATLERFPFLSAVSAAGREVLAELQERHAPARQRVLRPGDPVEGVYLVTDGALRVFHVTPEGREATLYLVEPGETCVLALTASFRAEPYPAWVETDRPVTFVLVPGPLFRRLLGSEASFREFLFSALSGRVFELMTRLEEVGSLRVEQRVAAFLVRRADPDGVVHVTQERLAAHLGTAREVVVRALRALGDRGLVETSRGAIRVRPGLAAEVADADLDLPGV